MVAAVVVVVVVAAAAVVVVVVMVVVVAVMTWPRDSRRSTRTAFPPLASAPAASSFSRSSATLSLLSSASVGACGWGLGCGLGCV